jgi:hypothetical protein
MSTPTKTTLDDIREILIDFGLPALIMLIAGVLLFCGKDGEVKTILAMAAGWLFSSGVTYKRVKK